MQQQAFTEVPFALVRPQSFYTIQGVRLPNDAYGDVQVTEKLLDNGRFRTPGEWRVYRKETGWGPGSGPLVTAVLTALYDHRAANGVEDLKKMFRADLKKHWMATATGITYRAGASDVVTHDSGTPEQITLEARLAGSNGYIKESMTAETQALFGNGDVAKVRDVFKWVTGKSSCLWRLDEPKRGTVERALVLGYGDFYYDLYIYAFHVYYGRPARGVRIAPQNSTGSKG